MLVTTNFGIWKSTRKRAFFHDVEDKNTRSSYFFAIKDLGVVFDRWLENGGLGAIHPVLNRAITALLHFNASCSNLATPSYRA